MWPSRIKVIATGVVAFFAVSKVGSTLVRANVSWLDLTRTHPDHDDIRCKSVIEDCRDLPPPSDSPLECIIDMSNNFVHALGEHDMDELLPGSCSATLEKHQCTSVNLPIGYDESDKGRLHTLLRSYNPFQTWGLLFRIFASLLVVQAVFHDLVLLSRACRPQILDWHGMQVEFPRLYRVLRKVLLADSSGKLLFLPRVLYRLIVYALFVYPVSVVCVILFPVRACRLGVFLSGVNVVVWGVVFLQRVYWWHFHEHWAVFFDADDVWKNVEDTGSCICYCEHPLSPEVSQRLVLLAVLMIIQSFGMAFRSLKGLRQARWACLFTVTYAMPIEVFPVVWGRPDEKEFVPIQRRRPDEPVQGEPAFDAFALMDEQPESWRMKIELKPVLLPQAQASKEDWIRNVKNAKDHEMLCCGFPSFHEDQRQETMAEDSDSDGSDSSDSSEDEKRPQLPKRAARPRQRPAAARTVAVPAQAAEVEADEEGYRKDQLGKWRPHVDDSD